MKSSDHWGSDAMKLIRNRNFLIVGLGLMGGSYAKALHRNGFRVTAITKEQADIDYAIEQYQKQVTKVHNHKAYMLTVLYQAKSQGELDISNRVMYDFYGAGRKVNGTGGGADG